MYHVSLAQSRISPLELAETKFPLIYNRFELAQDSLRRRKKPRRLWQ